VPFCLFLGTKRRSQCVFAMSPCAIKSNPRTEFNVSCLLCILRVLSCSKGSFTRQFLNVSWIIIYAWFFYFLGRNGALNMFAQCSDMPTGLTMKSVHGFLVSNTKVHLTSCSKCPIVYFSDETALLMCFRYVAMCFSRIAIIKEHLSAMRMEQAYN
jgi:hypothetical protein